MDWLNEGGTVFLELGDILQAVPHPVFGPEAALSGLLFLWRMWAE